MLKIKSLEELKRLREQAAQYTGFGATGEIVIAVGMSTCGIAAGASEVMSTLLNQILTNNLDNVSVIATGCLGFCYAEPMVEVRVPGQDTVRYGNVNEEVARDIVSKHICQGIFVEDSLFSKGNNKSEYQSQVRIALRNCGVIDPENIEDYIFANGYEALGDCIYNLSQENIIKTIKDSGLRGRGGAGFLTGLKWEFAHGYKGDKKFVVCNADEGDPGVFMDRSILEGDPHSVLEAMAICGYAIGSDEGVIYIRAEYPLAVQRLRIAIAQAEDYGLLGENILGSNFNFHISLNLGAGAFVCGEETALLNSLEGGRDEPRTKPPFPAERSFWQKPTNINNVETYANIGQIILRGSDWFKTMGTEKSICSKVFA